jgi:drug/metabolite transporter (DMT)-like permease
LTLLFQFSWMGVVLEAIVNRRLPGKLTVLAIVVILIGTLFSTDVVSPQGLQDFLNLNPLGLAAGVGSALTYTAYLFLAGRVEVEMPAPRRSFFMAIGSLVLTLVINPAYFLSAPQVISELGWLTFALAFAGILLPMLLAAYSAPHLPTGLTTIMAASELPCGILCSVFILGDPCGPEVIIGILLVLGGIALSQVPALRAASR